jgi:hypothetical protein
MYIKKVTKQNKTSKKKYEYLHLVENIRTERGPRQRLILNLGKIDIPKESYKELANCIEAMITGQMQLFTINPEIKEIAKRVTKKLLLKNAQEIPENIQINEPEYIPANLESISYTDQRSLGPELVCDKVWNELNLSEIFLNAGISKTSLPIIQALIYGRLISPGSEHHTHYWAENLSSLYELTDPAPKRSLNSFYRAGDKIFSLKDLLEEKLAIREKELFNLKEKILLMDLTNTYFEGDMLSNPKAQRGHSKEKRSDCKLLTLALIIDEQGFPKYSKLYPGNQSEFLTFKEMIGSLMELRPELKEDRTVLIDRGIASNENIDYLKKEGIHYIVVSRKKSDFQPSDDMEIIREDDKTGNKIEVKRYEDKDEVHLFCKSHKRVGKEEGIRSRQENIFIERLEYYKNGLNSKNRTKTYSKILESIGRIKQKYPKAAELYNIEVIMSETKNVKNEILTKDIIWSKISDKYNREISNEGCYVLRTDLISLSDVEIWETYNMLTRIEKSFRTMKSFLGARPNFHQLEQRADAHLFISVLAYHILNIIEYKLRIHGDTRNWATIRKILSNHSISTISFDILQENKRKKYHLRLPGTPEPAHNDIYKKLDVKLNRVKAQRNIY